MRKCLSTKLSRCVGSRQLIGRSRGLGTIAPGFHHVERVSVQCGSSGSISIDLHNIAKVSSSDPLLVYLPPHSTAFGTRAAQLPKFCQKHPTAVINYRWAGLLPFDIADTVTSPFHGQDGEDQHLTWPTPIHDALKAYSWIVENLSPPMYTRRDIYVYGSYLGASLATSMALTETHPHERMAVRGCVAYNGIYNWTTFLPDHPINKAPAVQSRNFLEEILTAPGDPDFLELKQYAKDLFEKPDNLFDPFASSCLLFHTPGLLVPPTFNASAIPPGSVSMDSSLEAFAYGLLTPPKQPRKSPLAFPPRKSTLKIPEMLLLHTSPPPLPPSLVRRPQRRTKEIVGNNFASQAGELARLMRRSIEKLELKDRMKWDDDFDGWDQEPFQRVQVCDVGHEEKDVELCGEGDELARVWLEDRVARRI